MIRHLSVARPDSASRHDALVAQEKRIYERCLNVHHLPPIFHYWSERHLRPKLAAFGLTDPNSLFISYLEKRCGSHQNRQLRFASLGAGNGELEISLAQHLRIRGFSKFTIDCLDLNSAMLTRAREASLTAGVADRLNFIETDLNSWNPPVEYDAVIANQSLHHIVSLERVFDALSLSLRRDGHFIISDMIGRNGHQRWPEALEIVREFWRGLPPSYRFNRLLETYDERFEDQDCSSEAFEGIRSQDILPLLIERFHFELFIPFANLIDPFIDRCFGPNFDAEAPWDRAYIDQVHERDDRELFSGHLKPTHMLAVVTRSSGVCPRFPDHMSPQFCVRTCEAPPGALERRTDSAYEWNAWPHDPQTELALACDRLAAASRAVAEGAQSAAKLELELERRTAWALEVDHQLGERTTWALQLAKEVEKRTAWAMQLEEEMSDRTAWALSLDEEVKAQARLIEELRLTVDIQTSRAEQRERQFAIYCQNPLRFAARSVARIFRRYAIRVVRKATVRPGARVRAGSSHWGAAPQGNAK